MKRLATWLSRSLYCHGGRLCADVVPSMIRPEDIERTPEGATLHIEFVCESCGTKYLRRAEIRNGAFRLMPREIIG